MAMPPLPPLNFTNTADLGDTSIQNGGITGAGGAGWPFSSQASLPPGYQAQAQQSQILPGIDNTTVMIIAAVIGLKVIRGKA